MTTKHLWAKLVRDADGKVAAALPLIDHCLDVGAAMAVVVAGWRAPLEAAARCALTDGDMARLCALAALHDLGKANRGFQARIDPKAKPIVGHTGPVAALLNFSGFQRSDATSTLGAIITDWGAYQHFAATMAHHGRPLAEFHDGAATNTGLWTRHVGHWVPGGDGDPAAAVLPLVDAVRARWPLAWEPAPPLPDAGRFVALFAGLVTLADWLGSDTRRFPVEGPHGSARDALRAEQAAAAAEVRGFQPLATPDTGFQEALGFPPHGFQTDAAAADLGPVALIEAETGSGKTEAALWRWLELRRRGEVDGLFFALPTRSAAVQLHARVNRTLERVWGTGAPEAVLAVPGYLRSGEAEGQALPGYAVRWDRGEPGGAEDARWAAERANRFLAARVAVGTIDQALLGVLPVKHALFRAGVLSRSLLVVDEVHASDAYMTGLLERLLDHHVAVGGRALLLSATLGSAARGRLLGLPEQTLAAAGAEPYPALSGRGVPPRAAAGAAAREKRVAIETSGIIADADAIAARALAAARLGAAVLVVRNTVGDAVAVARGVAALAPDLAFAVAGTPTLHHGRFARDDRQRLDEAVEKAFGRKRGPGGCVLVGTQTLEQSLDIDADYLITDLAPIDVLLQRIGRLHRHPRDDRGAFAEARVLVLRPGARDLTPLLAGKGAGHGFGRVYPNIVQLEATLAFLEANPAVVIPCDNRRLVEGALHPEALARIAEAGGALWIGHERERRGGDVQKGQSAAQVALDLSQRFRTLVFQDDAVATRLGARDLIVDVDAPLAGPFGISVARFHIPAWLVAADVTDRTAAERLDDTRFRLGSRTYRYDEWGLQREG